MHAYHWVEVEWTILPASERAASTPPDTARTPYVARTRGYASGTPRIGDEVQVTTASGRRVRGQVVSLRPGHHHSFGRPEPAWLEMKQSIHSLVESGR